MCFSAPADLVAGIVIAGVGVDTLRHVRHHREAALAGLPVLFGVHQLMEVPVWLGLDGYAGVAHGFAVAYLLVAFGVVPWVVPLAIARLEPEPGRARFMAATVVLGAAVAVALLVPTLTRGVSTADGGAFVDYRTHLVLAGPLTVAYVVATCGALLASSDRVVVWYGVANLVAVVALAVLLTSGVVSLWCVWAAVTSIAIAVHLRRLHRAHAGGRPATRTGTPHA
ncbi:hypothetical protein Q6348_10170 [Isoptericola sp. b441]|uniref:Uncharacterized protein n=1 Tax=Actinotalea lenta TaxID=3064654 RepID=A0ABT9DBA0_9CELL|nr:MULTISPECIES: DUF6629 family protein [unclassified Isoptericola]MDO8107559.1 hypothetical protein [Isoptericola sp. b441]MDO8120781.1 hypothetical protein [Isoptericola sp. b490]